MTRREKHLNHIAASIASLYLFTILLLGGIYRIYETKPLSTTYAYEKALQEAIKESHFAKLTISPTIRYGGTGYNSLRKVTHIIELLRKSHNNKGLILYLAPMASTRSSPTSSEIVSYTILQQSLEDYKRETNRPITVYTTPNSVPSEALILAIADYQSIVKPATAGYYPPLPDYAYVDRNNGSLIRCQAQNDNDNKKLPPHAGKFKVINDPYEENHINEQFKKTIKEARHKANPQYFQKIGSLLNLQDISAIMEDIFLSNPHPIKSPYKPALSKTKVPIIDLTPSSYKYHTPEYTSKKRNAYRRTTACFETIMISGDINPTLVKKITPLIKSLHSDPNIKGVIVVWASPGGQMLSAMQLLHLLKKLEATKPIVHIAAGQCESGAYLLAAATGRQLIAYKNSVLGSIGVKESLIAENQGKYNSQYTNQKWEKIIQQELEKLRQWLIEEIAQNRAPILNKHQEKYRQKLRETEARSYIDYRALEENLIDQTGTFQDAINALKKYTGLDLPVYYSENEA